jgi:serine/threonine protein kinase
MAECPSFDTILSQISTGKLLGSGSQGAVYKVGDYVLKKVKLSTPKAKILFDGEASSLEVLSSNPLTQAFLPPLCWIHKTAETGYILQKYEPVRTLKDLITKTPKGTLPFDVGYALYKNLRAGVSRIGKVGYFHRDIKPENILIRTDSEEAMKNPIFIDFGLACLISQCKTAIKAGTPDFMVRNFTPREIHKKQPTMKIGTQNRYIKTVLIPYEVTVNTEFYALALTIEEMLPIIDFTGHTKEQSEIQSFIHHMKQMIFLNTFRKRRNLLAERLGYPGTLKKYTYESEGTGTGPAVGGKKKRKTRRNRY